MKRWAVAGLLVLLTGCVPPFRIYLYDGTYRDCAQMEQTSDGWWCDGTYYVNKEVKYVVTSLTSY